MSITVLNPGLLTTVRDLGRIGYQQFGVSVSGVMDPRSAGIANILAGNPQGEAVLECTMMGPQLQFDRANCIAIAGGDLGPTLDGKPIPSHQAVSIKAGPRSLLLYRPFRTGLPGLSRLLPAAWTSGDLMSSRSAYRRLRSAAFRAASWRRATRSASAPCGAPEEHGAAPPHP
ncbi:MAG: hypothetical protein ACLRWQ_03500 [Flavonifractor plautii]